MKLSTPRIAIVATLACVIAPSFRGFADTKSNEQESSPEKEKSLVSYLRKISKDKEARYVAAFVDLNGDGRSEAVVYLISDDVCGSGGCNTMILAPAGPAWRLVTTITISNPPIIALQSQSHGWRNIAVRVQGGGIRSGHEAELRFNGRTYARNPSVPPAEELKGNQAGDVLIKSERDAKPLYGQGTP